MEPELIPATSPETPLPPPELPAAQRIRPEVFRLLGPLLAAVVLGFFLDGEFGHFLVASWEVALLAVL